MKLRQCGLVNLNESGNQRVGTGGCFGIVDFGMHCMINRQALHDAHVLHKISCFHRIDYPSHMQNDDVKCSDI